MKDTGTLILKTLAFGLLFLESNAQLIENQSPKIKNEYIAYINVLNPLLFGKAGAAFSIRTQRMDYFVYGNYRFKVGALPNRIYFSDSRYGMPKPSNDNTTHGFDIGTQFRFRSPLLSKPYAQYVQNLENTSSFYLGLAVELSYAEISKPPTNPNGSGSLTSIWEPNLSGLMGWTLNAKQVIFDIHLDLGAGVSFIDFEPDALNTHLTEPTNFTPFTIKYEIGILIGYKL